MKSYYVKRISQLDEQIKQKQKQVTVSSKKRFLLFLGACLLVYLGWGVFHMISLSILSFLMASFLMASLFILINRDNKKNKKIQLLKQLATLYKNELGIEKENFFGNGKEYEDTNHSYSSDLDIFGEASVYQHLNRMVTHEGREIIVSYLQKRSDKSEIMERQKVIQELSEKESFKEKFLSAFFISKKISLEEQSSKIYEFISNPYTYFTGKTYIRILSFALPVLTLGSFIIGLFYSSVLPFMTCLIFLSLVINTLYFGKVNKILYYIDGKQTVFFKYATLMQFIKEESFEHLHLKSVQDALVKDYKIDRELINLSNLTERTEYRKNLLVWFFLNTFLFWDIHCAYSVEKWFFRNSKHIPFALQQVGIMDAYLSLSILRFNHKEWVFPVLSETYFTLEGCQVGHPLIPDDRRISNDFCMKGKGIVDIITGSNMAGKSTFLRTLGVNMVLAFAGAPVCARSFTVTPVDILTYMRTRDSLNENTSSFYAELLRIKGIITEINQNKQCFLLLDELLKGTNSEDKYTGSVAIVKTLLKEETMALVSTHDLALTRMEDDYPDHIQNYHFDISVEGDDFFFTYTLQKGVCKNFNACLLMKKIGIELDLQ